MENYENYREYSMAEIAAAMVKALREETEQGMMGVTPEQLASEGGSGVWGVALAWKGVREHLIGIRRCRELG